MGHDLIAPERLARQTQEQLAVGAQCLPGEGIERGPQAHLGLLQELQPVRVLQGARFQAHLRGGQLDAQRLDAPHGAQLRKQRAEHCAGGERGAGDDEYDQRTHRWKCAR